MPPRLDRSNIQGNVLRGYSHPEAAFVFLHFRDAQGGKAWLREAIGQVTTAAPWEQKPSSTLNVAFTFSGLEALGLAADSLGSFPTDLRQGMAARAELLGDRGANAPGGWESPFRRESDPIHALVAIYGLTAADVDARLAWLRESAGTAGAVETLAEQRASRPKDAAGNMTGKEHFGFADGFSQPAFEVSEADHYPGDGARAGHTGWRDLAAGEFLLGHRDETGHQATSPSPHALGRDGTYVVYRKLAQDVPLFRRYAEAQGHTFPGGATAVGAAIVGRWPDGSPLSLSPDRADPTLGADPARNNDFDFADDPEGMRCPVGSHIRRANPRLGIPYGPERVNRHRILRRGIPYGRTADDPAAPDEERGLIFICLQASISRQFEVVQSQWITDGDALHVCDDVDPLAGATDGTGKLTVQGRPPRFLPNIPQFVTLRGGDYFFMPGLEALRYIAER